MQHKINAQDEITIISWSIYTQESSGVSIQWQKKSFVQTSIRVVCLIFFQQTQPKPFLFQNSLNTSNVTFTHDDGQPNVSIL